MVLPLNSRIDIHLRENFSFDETHLETYKKINVRDRFPLIYNYENKTNISIQLVPLDKIQIPNYLEQKVRKGVNPKYADISLDINTKGLCLDGHAFVLNKVGDEYKVVDGVTKLTILRDTYKVKNVCAIVFDNLDKSDCIVLGVQLNHKDKPFGQASIDDIKVAVKELANLNSIKSNGISLEESIKRSVQEMSLDKIPTSKLDSTVTEIKEDLTGKSSHDNIKTEAQKTKKLKDMNLTSDSQTMYLMVKNYPKSALWTACDVYHKHSKLYQDLEIRLVIHGGVLDSVDPVKDWENKILPFPKDFTNYLTKISNIFFGGKAPNFDKVKVYGGASQLKDNDNYTHNKLYKF